MSDFTGGNWQTPAAPFTEQRAGMRAECVEWYRVVTGNARDVIAQVNVSSSRISCLIETFFVPDTVAENLITGYNANWRITALAWNASRSWAFLHRVDPDPTQTTPTVQAMPTAYEVSSGIRAYHIRGEFDGPPVIAGPVDVQGAWFIRARFEVNTPMPDDIAQALLSRCSVSVANQISSAP